MRYLLAVICPPLVVLLTGKPVQALLSSDDVFLFSWINSCGICGT
ncbi:hypothetical protein [Bacillus sp. FDAARGOS_1420]